MITGSFTKVEIPASLKPGATIPIRVGYTAKNPGALYWSTAILAKVGTAPPRVVASTKEIAETGGGFEHSYNLGTMPNERTTIRLRLLGHDEAGHVWTAADWRD